MPVPMWKDVYKEMVFMSNPKSFPLIAITFDTDWAPDELVDYCVELCLEYRVKVTLFCTHPGEDVSRKSTNLMKRGYPKDTELAIHPKFVRGVSFRETLALLSEEYPDAKGVRSHSILVGWEIIQAYEEVGIQYDSNFLLHFKSVWPFFYTGANNGVLELPIYFMDQPYCGFASPKFHSSVFNIKRGLRVFDFHPIHVYLNTNDLRVYQAAKQYYHDPIKLIEYRAAGEGIYSLLTSLLTYVRANNIPTYTMSEINTLWRMRV